jgi:hypothetical protein
MTIHGGKGTSVRLKDTTRNQQTPVSYRKAERRHPTLLQKGLIKMVGKKTHPGVGEKGGNKQVTVIGR